MSKVLIIDDDLDMCRLLERFLIRNNFDVRFVHTGKKGWRNCRISRPMSSYAISAWKIRMARTC
jgi:two-component system response regulator HydG